MKILLWLLLPLVCFGYAGYGIWTGRIATRRYVADGEIRRSERPGLFWGYVVMLLSIGTFTLVQTIRSM